MRNLFIKRVFLYLCLISSVGVFIMGTIGLFVLHGQIMESLLVILFSTAGFIIFYFKLFKDNVFKNYEATTKKEKIIISSAVIVFLLVIFLSFLRDYNYIGIIWNIVFLIGLMYAVIIIKKLFNISKK